MPDVHPPSAQSWIDVNDMSKAEVENNLTRVGVQVADASREVTNLDLDFMSDC